MRGLSGEDVKLNWRQYIFLKTFCYPPPGRPDSHEKKMPIGQGNHLVMFETAFGKSFGSAIKNKVVLDIGCGGGAQVISMAQCGAAKSIGADYRPNFVDALDFAIKTGIKDRTYFTTEPLRSLGEGSVDVVASQNAFEHFKDPAVILADAKYVLKPGGQFFIVFSPPWLHPFGVHMFFMIKYPWAHFLFSEQTIMAVRKMYRNDGATRFIETEGGLNQMTISKFERLVSESGFECKGLSLTPIRIFPMFLTKLPGLRELITTVVSAELVRPAT
jgi:2-polyprenyl-3-methyl-5-hydroxy-6-metoxy-1,4-benzoquinol methylase